MGFAENNPKTLPEPHFHNIMHQATLTLLLFPFLLVASEPMTLFFDDFEGPDSFHGETVLNPTAKVYGDAALAEGHLLKKWNYSWEPQYMEGDWKQAFYVVPPGKNYMIQAGRSGAFIGAAPYRITANAEIPTSVRHYRVEFRQYKHDNDPVFYVLGGDIRALDGVEIGYMNKVPGTDTTTDDLHVRGNLLDGLLIEGAAHPRKWVDVSIDVHVESQMIEWHLAGQRVFRAHAKELRPGGYFGIYMRYERNTRFDDFKISIIQDDSSEN